MSTREELLKRAQELGVVGRYRMNKADLTLAIARKEAERAAADLEMRAIEQRVREVTESATPQIERMVWAAADKEFQAAAQEVRKQLRLIAESELQPVREAARVAADQEVQAAERHVREAAQTAAEDSSQATVQPGRAARWNTSTDLQKVGTGVSSTIKTVLIAVVSALITALATAVLANDYYTSRIGDWAFRRGTPVISTKVTLERESRVQGLTWVFHDGLGDLSVNEGLLLGKATASPNEFNKWALEKRGVDVDASFVKLIITGQRQAGVVITGMQAKVEKRGPPLRGAFFYAPPEGERENAQVGFNLDENIAVARLTDHNKDIGDAGYLGDEYFKSYNIPLKLGEDQVITIVSSTSSYYYAWYIELEVQAGGSTHYIKVDRRGNMNAELGLFPFEISARADSREHEKGVFSVYKELYVLRKGPFDKSADPVGFISIDPDSYSP